MVFCATNAEVTKKTPAQLAELAVILQSLSAEDDRGESDLSDSEHAPSPRASDQDEAVRALDFNIGGPSSTPDDVSRCMQLHDEVVDLFGSDTEAPTLPLPGDEDQRVDRTRRTTKQLL